jgi:nucleoside-diphosphate-sugar epimerase
MALPPHSLIFVTGVSGLIGSHVADTLLSHGFSVRGAVRSADEAQMMISIYTSRHPNSSFDPVIIADMKIHGAFDGHLSGCSAVAHVASDLSFSPDPNVVITGCVNGIKSILRVAAETPSVQRFVYTSSSNAATNPISGDGEKVHVDSGSWNHDILEIAWAPPPYEANRAYAVYAASKVACEQAAWEFVKEEKPHFVFNTVLPNYTTGPILQPLSVPGAGITARWVRDAFEHPDIEEFISKIRDQDPQWQVDVEDIAKLHLAALTFEHVRNERLFGFAHPFNYNSFLNMFRRLAPERTFPPDDEDQKMPATVIDTTRSVKLLRQFGQQGWTSFEDSVRRTCVD